MKKHIFYTNLSEEFHDKCLSYLICGSFQRTFNDESKDSINTDELLPFLNLDHDESKENETGEGPDAWMNNAARIYNSIQQISSLIKSNESSYTYKDIMKYETFSDSTADENKDNDDEIIEIMSEEEAAMFESSIATFMTSTASQIETLNQSIAASIENRYIHIDQIQSHRSGIISHLLSELKEVMKRFQSMQHLRNRQELECYHEPFKCMFPEKNHDDVMDEFENEFGNNTYAQMDISPDDDYLNYLEEEEEQFQSMYLNTDVDYEKQNKDLEQMLQEPLPIFPSRKRARHGDIPRQSQEQTNGKIHFNNTSAVQQAPEEETKLPVTKPSIPTSDFGTSDNDQFDILQQEQAFITTEVQNTKLDAAQKVESQMMQITTLLSQFSALISEQQEEIQMIADNTAKSKDNVQKGNEELVKANEQRKKSRHYFALIIYFMGFLLLFMNAVVK